ncbi:hypothetical protein PRIPAC_87474 [Pristionchus pacificus]|uniref:C2H2-type domain-containing protein n=1 Tax=Pristionchus pacificus TaxID=54126 RepID=A0A2A6CVA4_PRIPA|nr:hypothetical protein PRIPAC_87474 [Pristionchus pacificus]|eukprot:PDM82030.1 hypothetical protein PRIPAC_36423 [Pristionchus pacificus]
MEQNVPVMEHPCIIHGCGYSTNRRWNLFTHLQRKHQYPANLIESMKHVQANNRKRTRMLMQHGYDFHCGYCDLAYPSKKRLNEHVKRKHPERRNSENGAQVTCPAPGCKHVCQTRERLVHHAAVAHASAECKYMIEHVVFDNEDVFHSWKLDLEKDTESSFSINSGASAADSKRTYMWCAKANKVRVSKPLPDAERKRFGNYSGRTKRVQSHCTAFITACFHSNGEVEVKFCRDHIGHNQQIDEERKPRVKKEQIDDELESDDDDSLIDVGGDEIDHEEYVEDEGVHGQRMYLDEDDDEGKKPVIRFLTASDRMRPQLNPSYAMEEEYEEEEEEPGQSQPAMRYLPPTLHPQERLRMAYPRPVRPHMRNEEIKEEEPDLTSELLRQSHQRVRSMHGVITKKGRDQGRYNHHLQVPMKIVSPIRRVRRPTKNEPVVIVETDRQQLYELDPEDIGQEEVVEEETVYIEEPGSSYEKTTATANATAHAVSGVINVADGIENDGVRTLTKTVLVFPAAGVAAATTATAKATGKAVDSVINVADGIDNDFGRALT